MTAKELKLMTFAYLGEGWAPCGQLTMTEQGTVMRPCMEAVAYG
ncbi:MAG: hypothetical protein Q7U75_09660 [Desulfobacterales bacterium]|nr:hypothetical protein [Desulfobacterales bacterium]